MDGMRWSVAARGLEAGDGPQPLPEDLRQVASGTVALDDAFLRLAHHQDEQAHTAADLLERETWALTMILIGSAPLWNHRASPTLRFEPDRPNEPVRYHLELGLFSHLAALLAPSTDEQALITSRTPGWVRVYPHHERLRAGQIGALAHSYVSISVAEAVATLGLGRILAQVEAATRAAGQVLLTQSRAQRERKERLLCVERMLGWDLDPAAEPLDPTLAARSRLALALLKPASRVRPALGLAFLGCMVVLICFLTGISQAMIGLVAAGSCLLIWRRVGTT